MRLYYLTAERWAKVILKERRLKVSLVKDLNDPFELHGACMGDKRAREVVKHVRRRLCEHFGLICMSTTWQNPVMWAHYADKHKGVCLGFDVLDNLPKEVRYTGIRLTNLLSNPPTLGDMDGKAIDVLVTTKYKDWSYEREWRLLIPFVDSIKDSDGKCFLPFDTKMLTIREVILGNRCPWSLHEAAGAVQESVKTVGGFTEQVTLKRVRPSFQKFEMVRQKHEVILHVKPTN